MNTNATIARQLSVACEAKKVRYWETVEGKRMLTIELHPQEDEALWEVAVKAPRGQRYLLAMVALNQDDDTPREGVVQHQPGLSGNNARPASSPARAKRSWDELTPAQQAGVLCADKSFQKFMGVDDEEYAATKVRVKCKVVTRSNIIPGTRAGELWRHLVEDYRAWMREPSVVPA